MNIFAIVLIALGIGLVIVGWNGTYPQVWGYLGGSNQVQGNNPPVQQQQQPGLGLFPQSQQQQGPMYHPAYQRYQ